MYKTTMKEVIALKVTREQQYMHFLYQIVDGVTLYVGRSYDPVNRIRQHVGLTSLPSYDDLGSVFKEEFPQSEEWEVLLYKVDDCIDLVWKHIMKKTTWYTKEFFLSPEGLEGVITHSELALIYEYKPCLNVQHNVEATDLPGHYKRMNPTDSSSLYLDL